MQADPRIVKDWSRPGAWVVQVDGMDQSYVDRQDPTYLAFEYAQRIGSVIDTAFASGERIAAIHVGGAGLTLARYIAHTRPTSAQLVFEPDQSLTAAVRQVIPLPRQSGIKIRPQDGRTGLRALSDHYADLVIVDAFKNGSVPGDLATTEFFCDVRRVLRPGGTLAVNVTDLAPLSYSRRLVAGVAAHLQPVTVAAERSTLTGRRFGNLVVAAGGGVDPGGLTRQAAAAAFPYRVVCGTELKRWLGNAQPFTDADTQTSPPPPAGLTAFT